MKTPTQRWEDGNEHHPRSVELMNRICQLDFENGDYFCWKTGGDGDNGEVMLYLLDMYFEEKEQVPLGTVLEKESK